MTESDTLIACERHARESVEFRLRLLRMLARGGLDRFDRSDLFHYRLRVAATLLKSGMSRADARHALRVRLGVTERTAYRLIRAAMGQRAYKGGAQ